MVCYGVPYWISCSIFLVLLKKHKVLYAPSDFADETNFMTLLQDKVGSEIEDAVKLLEVTKENNKTNVQLVERIDKALSKLEIAKQSNEMISTDHAQNGISPEGRKIIGELIKNNMMERILNEIQDAGESGVNLRGLLDATKLKKWSCSLI